MIIEREEKITLMLLSFFWIYDKPYIKAEMLVLGQPHPEQP